MSSSPAQLLDNRHRLIKLNFLPLRRLRDPDPRSRPRPMEIHKGSRVCHVHDADVPTVQILCAGVLRREITQEILEFRDQADVVRHLELLCLGGSKTGCAVGTELRGDGEHVALGGAGDDVAGGWRGRGEAAFDACRGNGVSCCDSDHSQGDLRGGLAFLQDDLEVVGDGGHGG